MFIRLAAGLKVGDLTSGRGRHPLGPPNPVFVDRRDHVVHRLEAVD